MCDCQRHHNPDADCTCTCPRGEHAEPTNKFTRIKGKEEFVEVNARQAEIEANVVEISGWWAEHSDGAIQRTAPKAAEYGAADLDIMASAMIALAGEKLKGASEEERMQYGRYAACAFYAMGKAARIFGALERGVLPNPDSEFDLEVYSVMMARIREFGKWV